ncbi:MAG: hypothetical protein Q9162_002481 [Coniocarpon cinnabarinum]
MPENRSRAPLVWIDCEMTGLDPTNDSILSVACFITDSLLNLLDPHGYHAIVHHTHHQLAQMGEWCTRQHGASGLTEACLTSTTTATQAAQDLLAYIQRHVHQPRLALLAGNSVYSDKLFLMQQPYAPVIDYLHYRILDVSAIKEAAKRWSPEPVLAQTPQKEGKHEAKADILESIAEARFYRDAFFTLAA